MFVLKKTLERETIRANQNNELAMQGWQSFYAAASRVTDLETALQTIIEQQTAKPNATVARMVKIAEEALAGETPSNESEA